MHVKVTQLISAIHKTYPLSRKDIAQVERPDLVEQFKDFSEDINKIGNKYELQYPEIVKDIYRACETCFIYFDFLSYRHLGLPDEVQFDLESFRKFRDEFGPEWDYWCNNKIPLFSSDGNYDVLDLTRYNKDTDDCPVIYYNHEDPDQRLEICSSLHRYIELLAIEISSGDRYDWEEEKIDAYRIRMQQRGTAQLITLE